MQGGRASGFKKHARLSQTSKALRKTAINMLIFDVPSRDRGPLLDIGFRPFFLGAAVFSVLSMFVWLGAYAFQWPVTFAGGIPAILWHSHEMLYGYALAVIAGFLPTAVKQWTGISTVSGAPLLALFMLWMSARVSNLAGGSNEALYVAGALNTLNA